MFILVKLPNGDFINLALYSSFRFADADEVCQAFFPTGKSDFIRGDNAKALRKILDEATLTVSETIEEMTREMLLEAQAYNQDIFPRGSQI